MFNSADISKHTGLSVSAINAAAQRCRNAKRIGEDPLTAAEALTVAAHADGAEGLSRMATAIHEPLDTQAIARAVAEHLRPEPAPAQTAERKPATWTSPAGQLLRQAWTAEGEPLFVVADVCRALEIKNPSDALKGFPARWRGIEKIYTVRPDGKSAGKQKMHVVTEAGLYRLVMRSSKPEAEAFQVWICEEVLPAIRKTGRYVAPGADLAPTTVDLSPVLDGIRQLAVRLAALEDRSAEAPAAPLPVAQPPKPYADLIARMQTLVPDYERSYFAVKTALFNSMIWHSGGKIQRLSEHFACEQGYASALDWIAAQPSGLAYARWCLAKIEDGVK